MSGLVAAIHPVVVFVVGGPKPLGCSGDVGAGAASDSHPNVVCVVTAVAYRFGPCRIIEGVGVPVRGRGSLRAAPVIGLGRHTIEHANECCGATHVSAVEGDDISSLDVSVEVVCRRPRISGANFGSINEKIEFVVDSQEHVEVARHTNVDGFSFY